MNDLNEFMKCISNLIYILMIISWAFIVRPGENLELWHISYAVFTICFCVIGYSRK